MIRATQILKDMENFTSSIMDLGLGPMGKTGEGILSTSLRGIFKIMAAMGIVVSMGSKVMAQADLYDSSSPDHVGNSIKIKRPKFNVSLSASALRGLDEFDEESAYYEGLVGMNISDNLRGDIAVGYSHPFDFDAERTDRWEWEDVSLRLLKPSVWKSDSKSQNLSLMGSLTLPTSGTSTDASLYSQLSLTARYTYRVKKFTFALSPSLVGAYHEFETADEDGFKKNSPWSASVGGSVRYGVTSKLGIVAGASVYTLFDYDFNNRNVQTVSGALQYSVNRKVSLSLSSRWRSRVITNNSLFDDDASRVALTLVYSI